MTLKEYLKGIADAIRTKKGTTELINAQDFANEIINLPSGGGGNAEDYFDLNVPATASYVFNNIVKQIPSNLNISAVTDMSSMFAHCSSLTTLDLSNWNISKVTKMNQMFYNCTSLKTLDLSNLDASAVTDMGDMFQYCSSLTNLNLSNLNTSAVKIMKGMFEHCTSLTTLDLSNLDTSAVTDMGYMFYNCSLLTNLNLSNLNISKVANMGSMFYNCTSLKTLDLSNLDTSAVTNMTYMFYNCIGLTTLDLSNLDTSKVTNMSYMFMNCTKLTTIQGIINMEKVTNLNRMFGRNYLRLLENIKIKNLNRTGLDLSYCLALSHESLIYLLENLIETTTAKTVTLGVRNLGKLTDEEKAIATNKGWTLA